MCAGARTGRARISVCQPGHGCSSCMRIMDLFSFSCSNIVNTKRKIYFEMFSPKVKVPYALVPYLYTRISPSSHIFGFEWHVTLATSHCTQHIHKMRSEHVSRQAKINSRKVVRKFHSLFATKCTCATTSFGALIKLPPFAWTFCWLSVLMRSQMCEARIGRSSYNQVRAW